MREFTKESRQKILDDYTARRGGFDARGFLREVRESNGTHPAWSWFEWNDGKAAEEYRVIQARNFVQGLRIKFEVKTIQANVTSIVVKEMPAYLSPLENRTRGGGYFQVDPENPEHRAELAMQAVQALDVWVRRYRSILEAMGGDLAPLKVVRDVLSPPAAEEPEEKSA